MRTRINRGAICSSSNYKASRKAHREYLKEQHSKFDSSICLVAVSSHTEPLPDTMVYIMILGKKMTVPYSLAKAAKYNYTLY